MRKYIIFGLLMVFGLSSVFGETDDKALKAIKALRYGTSDKYNLVSPKVKTRMDVDLIREYTAGNGVAIDGVTLKDGGVSGAGTTSTTNAEHDVISEKTTGTGVTVDGVLLKDGQIIGTNGTAEVKANIIAERTAATGVTIDSVLLKDGRATVVAGAVGTPSVALPNTNGLYRASASQMGLTINGALAAYVDANGFDVGQIDELVGGVGVIIDGVKLKDAITYTTGIISPYTLADERMWAYAPMLASMNLYSRWYDDWFQAGYIADTATLSGKFSETDDLGQWKVTVVDGTTANAETITIADDGPGGFLKITPNTNIADVVNIQLNGSGFRCDNTRDLWYETRLEIQDVSEDTVIFGLATTDGDIDGGYPDDYMLFRADESTNLVFVSCKNTVSTTNAVGVIADGSGTGASMVNVGIYVDGSETNQYIYFNSVAVATNAASATIPDDVTLSPVYEVKMTEAVADSIWIDYSIIINTK